MKKWGSYALIIFRNTLIILVVFEIALGFYYSNVDQKKVAKAVEARSNSGAYPNEDIQIAKEIHEESFTLETQWRPFVHYGLSEFNGKHITINKEGQRKTINASLKDSTNALQIFCFGGSTIFSAGARDAHTIPSELSKLIHESFPAKNIKITNFGCHGYSISTETALLQQQLLKNNIPDIVIFYDGVNDVNSSYQNNESGLPSNALYRMKDFNTTRHTNWQRFTAILTATNIYRFTKSWQNRFFKPKPYTVPNVEKLAIETTNNYKQNIELTEAFAISYGFKVFHFLQPVIYTKKTLTTSEIGFAKQQEYIKELFVKFYEQTQQDTLITKNPTFTDISRVFNQTKKTIYTDYCHTGEYANILVATEMFKKIKPILIQKDSILTN